MPTVDLRSDTVTVPCAAMRRAMTAAEVGDDVYNEDPTAQTLQRKLAEMAGQEAGLFFPSGTQSNLVALLSHCQRGDEYIVAEAAHTYRYEGGGAAALGGIQPQPVATCADGSMDLARAAAVIKADDFYFAKTKLLALENTYHGRVIGVAYLRRAADLAQARGLQLHLDGARVFNAAVALGVELAEITAEFDSVSICLSKGLGAPLGSVLCGPKQFIAEAKRWRKMTGGGMRQVGSVAAAGIYALEHNISRLQDDHALAAKLADALQSIDELEVVDGGAQTNMVFVRARDPEAARLDGLREFAAPRGILLGTRSGETLRMVVHKDCDEAGIRRTVDCVKAFFTD